MTNEKLVHKVVDFENLSDDDFAEHDVAISCLGGLLQTLGAVF